MSTFADLRPGVVAAIAGLALGAAVVPASAERQGPPAPHPGNPGTGNPNADRGPQRAHPGQGNAYARRGNPQPPGRQGASSRGAKPGAADRSQGRGAPSRSAPRGRALGHGESGGGSTSAKGATPRSEHAKAGKTTICHATGSETNPYVTITISDNALAAHRRHQDGRDLVPAPPTGCGGATQGRSGVGKAASQAAAGLRQAAQTPAGPTGAAGPADAQAVQGVQESSDGAPGSDPRRAAAATRELGDDDGGGALPFTGADLALPALAGAGALLAGVALRRSLRNRAPLSG